VLSATRRERAAVIEATASSCPLSALGRTFPVLYADPPWHEEMYSDGGRAKAAEMHYPTMTVEEICAEGVPAITAADAVLFMWFLREMLPEALEVVRSWGFTYKTFGIWLKPNLSMGHWLRGKFEPLMVATRGNMPPPPELHSSVFEGAASGRHSGKPDSVRDWIAGAYPETAWIELFARPPFGRGWHIHGNEVVALRKGLPEGQLPSAYDAA
jgi:N6-adenosine-specific RNA methylase IME4